ncbi:MAG: hypothetical protein CMQ04_00965 [Gammaproteobacteria bacterium]|nr:hypothetical protein [Gammaproteobacteria bacterium]
MTLIDQIMIMLPMNLDKTSIAKQQELQGVPQGSAWMLAQCARLHDGSGNKASSSLLAAIVASLVMFGLQ